MLGMYYHNYGILILELQKIFFNFYVMRLFQQGVEGSLQCRFSGPRLDNSICFKKVLCDLMMDLIFRIWP